MINKLILRFLWTLFLIEIVINNIARCENDGDDNITEVGNSLTESEDTSANISMDNSVIDELGEHNKKVAENELSTQIFALIEHYKQPDPIGMPGAPVPDPFPVPDVSQSMGMGTLKMTKTLAYGLSKFRLKTIKTDLQQLTVNSTIQLDQMVVKGNYTLSSFFTSAQGPFTVVLKNVLAMGNASLAVERDGKLRAQDISMDMTFDNMAMDFQNLGFMGSIFQSFINSAPTLVFDTMKPFMFKEANTRIQTEINSNIKKLVGDHSFPNSISPLDMAIAEARKKVRAMGYDPYRVKDYNHTVGLFSMEMRNTWIMGISSFYRVGNVTIEIANQTVTIGLQVGTQRITGATQWELSVSSGMVTRTGQAQFTVEHIKVTYVVSQSLDTRKRPQIKDLQFELGNIQARCEGAGTLDYITEFLINILPNLLRYQIMDAIENPAKTRVQEFMDKIDVEKLIKEKVPEFEKMGYSMNFDFIT